MTINYNGENFDLAPNFSVTMLLSNPLISTRGEQTPAFTIPASDKNLRMTGYSNRIDNLYKPLTDIRVLVTDGMFCRWCNMSFNSIPNKRDGINVTLYLGTGEFYSLMSDKMLSSLPWPVVELEQDPRLSYKVDYLIDLLKSQYNNPTSESDFCMAPLATDEKVTFRYSKNIQSGYVLEDVTETFVLNGFEKWKHSIDLGGTGWDTLRTFQGEYNQKMITNGAEVAVTTGYGMTPFLKLRYVLNFIFDHFGYTFDNRSIEDEIQTFNDNICILNNVADAIYAGVLKYSKILPDIDIKTFFSEIERWFVGRFFVNELSKTAWFEFMNNSLSRYSDLNLDPYLRSEIYPGKSEFKTVIIKDSNDVNPETSTSEVEALTYKLLKDIEIRSDYYSCFDVPGWQLDVSLTMPSYPSISHRNSFVQINGEIKESESEPLKELVLLSVDNSVTKLADTNPAQSVNYKTAYNVFYPLNDMDNLNYLHTQYKLYRKDSNIPLDCELKIPEYMLQNINFAAPKIIKGQKVLIESIEIIMGKSRETTLQKVKLRTIRPFQDRT